MSKNGRHLQHVRSSEKLTNGNPKLPTKDDLEYGELALNFAKGVETLSIRNSEDEIVTFPNNVDIANITSAITHISEEVITYITSNDKSITVVSGKNTVDLSAQKPIISDGYVAVEYPKDNDNQTYPPGAVAVAAKDGLDTVAKKLDTSISALTQAVIENELVTSKALQQHNDSNGFDENGKYTGATADMKYIDKSTNLTEAVQILDGAIGSANININTISGSVEDSIDGLLILTSAVTRMNESLGFTENIYYDPKANSLQGVTKVTQAIDYLSSMVDDLQRRVTELENRLNSL